MVTNSAVVFIKPHAVTDKVKDLCKKELEKQDFKIVVEGSLAAEVIDEKKLIDQHYYAIASKATILKPKELNIPVEKFKEQFGLEWEDALASGKVFNAMDACAELGIDADQLDKEWAKTKANKKLIKFGGGFYCGLVEMEGKEPIYTFNGFFMAMRAKFTKPGESIYYYVVEWDATKCKWEDFRGKVIGPTDPVDAPAGSLRGMCYQQWEDLGLKYVPNVGDNSIHASASPFEGLAERNNWLSADIKDDEFGKAMLNAGFDEETIKAWSIDPQIKIDADGKKGSTFDQLEDIDSDECLKKCVELLALQK